MFRKSDLNDECPNGLFVVFESTSKCGKTTLSKLLYNTLADLCDREVILKRGALSASEFGKIVNALSIKDFGYSGAFYWADLILDTFDVIKKSVNTGGIVIQDRYDLSVVSYREAHGFNLEHILLDQYLSHGMLLNPDLTVFLKPSIEDILERIRCGSDTSSIDLNLLKNPERIHIMQKSIEYHLKRLGRNFITIDTGVMSVNDSLDVIINKIMTDKEGK